MKRKTTKGNTVVRFSLESSRALACASRCSSCSSRTSDVCARPLINDTACFTIGQEGDFVNHYDRHCENSAVRERFSSAPAFLVKKVQFHYQVLFLQSLLYRLAFG